METNEAQPLADTGFFPNPEFTCPKCLRAFKNDKALRMHTIRKHGRGWNTAQNFNKGRMTHEQIKEQKRKYNAKLRARYYAEGKNSRGEQMPPGWTPRKITKGTKWSPQQRAKFNATWRSKSRAKRVQIVYPDPKLNAPTKDFVLHEMEAQRAVEYCPHCGEHVKGWRYHQS